MTDEEKDKPQRVKFWRLTPQLKTFKEGTVLKTKQDLYYSLEEDIVETGGEDNWSPLFNPSVPGPVGPGTPAPSAVGAPVMPGVTATPNVPVHGGHSLGSSFVQSADFVHKEAMVMFTEAAQFRASDNKVYIRLQLIHGEKVVWINLLRVPQSVWGYMIRREQKQMIKDEIAKMFKILAPGAGEET